MTINLGQIVKGDLSKLNLFFNSKLKKLLCTKYTKIRTKMHVLNPVTTLERQ